MYYVYLGGMLLPTPPSEIKTKINNQNKTVRLANDGEINILKKAGLTDVSFDMRIFHNENPYTRELKPVEDYLSMLEILKQTLNPFQFIVFRVWENNNQMYDTNLRVSLEDYQIDEKASNGHMTVVNIKLKQYKTYEDLETTIEEKEIDGKKVLMLTKENKRYTDRKIPKSVKANKGDTLWDIAKKYLNDGSKYLHLSNINNLDNPNGIFNGGEVIRLG